MYVSVLPSPSTLKKTAARQVRRGYQTEQETAPCGLDSAAQTQLPGILVVQQTIPNRI